MFSHLLDQHHNLLYKVSSLFMDDHTPPLLFDSNSLVRIPVKNTSTNLRVQEEVRTFVVLVEFRKMPSAPFHEFSVFYVDGPGPRRYKALIIVDRYVGDVSNDILQGHGIPEDTPI